MRQIGFNIVLCLFLLGPLVLVYPYQPSVQISFDVSEVTRYPHLTAEVFPFEKRDLASKALESFFSKYQQDKLPLYLTKIVFVANLQSKRDGHQLNYGGTYNRNAIFVDYREYPWMTLTLHHELSSLLIDHHPDAFPHLAWLKASPVPHQGNTYHFLAMQSKSSIKELLSNGFITPYSQTSFSNDISKVSEIWLWDPTSPFLQTLLNQNPLICEKIKLVYGFYKRIDILAPDIARPQCK